MDKVEERVRSLYPQAEFVRAILVNALTKTYWILVKLPNDDSVLVLSTMDRENAPIVVNFQFTAWQAEQIEFALSQINHLIDWPLYEDCSREETNILAEVYRHGLDAYIKFYDPDDTEVAHALVKRRPDLLEYNSFDRSFSLCSEGRDAFERYALARWARREED